MRVADIMSTQIRSARPRDTVAELRQKLLYHKIHALPVIDRNGTPFGIVTATDLLNDCSPENPVAEVMTSQVHTVPADTDIRVAAHLMRVHHLHHLLIVDQEGKVSGVLSSFDLLGVIEDLPAPART
jgi:CBS domain-containing protein